MDPVRKDALSIGIQVGPSALPDRLLPLTSEEAKSSHWRKPFPEVLRAETFNTDFPHTSGLHPAPQLDL